MEIPRFEDPTFSIFASLSLEHAGDGSAFSHIARPSRDARLDRRKDDAASPALQSRANAPRLVQADNPLNSRSSRVSPGKAGGFMIGAPQRGPVADL